MPKAQALVLHALISQQRLGRRDLDLVPVLDDPKDLFGGTLAGPRASRGPASARRLELTP